MRDRPLTFQQMVEAMERALMGVKHELREHRHPIHDKTKLWTAPPSERWGPLDHPQVDHPQAMGNEMAALLSVLSTLDSTPAELAVKARECSARWAGQYGRLEEA